MKIFNYILAIGVVSLLGISCQKQEYTDTSFAHSNTAPDKLGMLFDITQDNTGKVTIIPTGEGVSYYEVNFGDKTPTPGNVFPSNTIDHVYAEGNYDVQLIAHNLFGQTTTFTQKLTVTFRAPEDLVVTTTIDPLNNFQLNLSATATYETNFRVYFGDEVNEEPTIFLEGQNITHIYPAIGTYTLKVIAVSGGAATTTFTKTVTITNPLLLPIDFESTTVGYDFANFDGGSATVVDNPYKTGFDVSNKVGKMVKNGGQPWGGSFLTLSSPIDFSTNKVFRMKVWSPRVGAKVLLKVENSANTSISYEKEVATTVANNWEDLIFDYSAVDASQQYDHIVLIFDNGTMGDGSANFTFYFDDIRLVNSVPLTIPVNFESSLIKYNFTDFDGGKASVVANPKSDAVDASSMVEKMVKTAGQTWGGSYLTLDNPIDFSQGKTFKMSVLSPRVGAKVLLKVENPTDGTISYEKEIATTKANAWEVLSFDYSGINTSQQYQKVTIIFDNGTMGDGSANYTFYFDNINLTN